MSFKSLLHAENTKASTIICAKYFFNYSNFLRLNLGFEYGQKGNTNMGLIKENYYGINIGLSFNDVWFKRRKFE